MASRLLPRTRTRTPLLAASASALLLAPPLLHHHYNPHSGLRLDAAPFAPSSTTPPTTSATRPASPPPSLLNARTVRQLTTGSILGASFPPSRCRPLADASPQACWRDSRCRRSRGPWRCCWGWRWCWCARRRGTGCGWCRRGGGCGAGGRGTARMCGAGAARACWGLEWCLR